MSALIPKADVDGRFEREWNTPGQLSDSQKQRVAIARASGGRNSTCAKCQKHKYATLKAASCWRP